MRHAWTAFWISNIRIGSSLTLLLFSLASCSKSSDPTAVPAGVAAPSARLVSGKVSISGSGTSKGSVAVTTTALNVTALALVRFNDPWGTSERTVDLGVFDQNSNFGGENGSISLVAETQNYPLSAGGAFPILSSFYVVPADGSSTVEYVNLTSQCRSQNMWICTGGNCDPNPACTVQAPSGFSGRSDWDQHQIPPYGYATTNTFPRCDGTISGWSGCPGSFGRLVSGHYYAKFLLLSDTGGVIAGKTADLKISLVVKKDTLGRNATATNGGMNVNVILVGDHNVNDSHTATGARNLNLLFKEVNRLFSSVSGASITINQIKTYEWSDANGGSQYSQIEYSKLGDLFSSGSKGVDSADSTKNMNIFIVSDITYSGANFTILGLSGGILGAPINGTQTSGLAFSSFDKLASYNSVCSSGSCARELLQNDFLEMAATIVHEMGHFLGLNHPSEKADSLGNQANDQLNDTPICVARTGSSSKVLDQRACYVSDTSVKPSPLSGGSCAAACNALTGGNGSSLSNSYLVSSPASSNIDPWTSYSNSDMPGKFCPAVPECQHNHIMWYTTKNRHLQNAGGVTCTLAEAQAGLCTWSEDGNLFSVESQAIIQWDPFVR